MPLLREDAIIEGFLLLGDLRNILEKWMLSTFEGSLNRGTRPLHHETIVESSCQLRHTLSSWTILRH